MDTRKKLAELEEEIMQTYSDKIVQRIIDKFSDRSIEGIIKYNTTLNDSEEGLLAFVNHAQDELMDCVLYLEKIKQIING